MYSDNYPLLSPATAEKPKAIRLLKPKMTTNDDIFAPDSDQNTANSNGYGKFWAKK